MMEMETLDKLYLEISQFTKAKTKTDLENERKIHRLEMLLNSRNKKLEEVGMKLQLLNEGIPNFDRENNIRKIVQEISDFLHGTKNGRPENPQLNK